jgi:hypothetical protein
MRGFLLWSVSSPPTATPSRQERPGKVEVIVRAFGYASSEAIRRRNSRGGLTRAPFDDAAWRRGARDLNRPRLRGGCGRGVSLIVRAPRVCKLASKRGSAIGGTTFQQRSIPC